MDEDEARDIFQETKKFLYLSQHYPVFIPDDLLVLDEMWHKFILFTPPAQLPALFQLPAYHRQIADFSTPVSQPGPDGSLKRDPDHQVPIPTGAGMAGLLELLGTTVVLFALGYLNLPHQLRG